MKRFASTITEQEGEKTEQKTERKEELIEKERRGVRFRRLSRSQGEDGGRHE